MGFFDAYKKSLLTYKKETSYKKQNIDEIIEGVSQNENYFFYRENQIINVFDKNCNHSIGKLSLEGKNGFCPLHGWNLDIATGKYTNNNFRKKPIIQINKNEIASNEIEIPMVNQTLKTLDFQTKQELKIRFLNHACLYFELENGFSFATDPWVFGSAFSNGWWLQKESPFDVFEILNNCDFIYISHNHPDHLHLPSLKKLRKSIPILTAKFSSNSTASILKEIGFKEIKQMDFTSRLVDEKNEFSIAILKSGDFRDDSGILIEIGIFKILLTVDSNLLNFGKLPKIDLISSSFAGGASGFPLCFENNSELKKKSIIQRNKKGLKLANMKSIELTNAKYFLPYAGFFSENAKRDNYIKINNKKNSVEDYQDFCLKNNCKLLNINNYQIYKFRGDQLISSSRDNSERYKDIQTEEYIGKNLKITKSDFTNLIFNYFKNSSYKDNLILDLITTDDDFTNYLDRFEINFNTGEVLENITLKNEKEYESNLIKKGNRLLRIKVRKDELIEVLIHNKPWEDLSIGFQCRIYRKPDVYNYKFWDYFTNIYISQKAFNLQRNLSDKL